MATEYIVKEKSPLIDFTNELIDKKVSPIEDTVEELQKRVEEGGTGGGVSSWNDLTDKPFGEKILVEILPKTAFQIGSANGYTTIETSATLQQGEEYTVIFDNVEYNCTAYDSQGVIAIGNELIIGGTNGNNEPFVVGDFNGSWLAFAQSAGSHVISVAQTDETQLDEKYIPNTIAKKDDISWSGLKNRPFGFFLGEKIGTTCDVTIPAEDLSECGPGVYVTPQYVYAGDFYLGDFTYEVIIDGVSYYTQAVDGYSNFDYLGSYNFLSNPNESEFPFLIYKDGSGHVLMYLAAEGSHTVKIIQYEGTYEFKPIEDKYIPDTIARVSDIPVAASEYEFVELLNEMSIVEPLASASGEIYTTNNNELYIL